MLHRIINWITNPFKKKEADTFSISEPAPLSEEVKNKIKADLIEAVKEFKEKKASDLDELPLSRVSEEAKEKISEIVKEDMGIATYPVTEEVVVSETPKTKKLRPFGLCAGEFVVPEDFDAPLQEEILNAFEGK